MRRIILFIMMITACCIVAYSSAASAISTTATPDLDGGQEKDRIPLDPLSLSQLHTKYPTYFRINGSTNKPEVALTFDDVPDPRFTPAILDVLKKYNVKATFFVVGNRAEQYPDLVKRMISEGHVVGNHSYNHPDFLKLSDADFHKQVNDTQAILKQLIGYEPALIRPPYGNVTEEQVKWLASQHMYIIFWNVDSLDWMGLTADQITANVLGHAGPGSIVLQHAGGGEGEELSGTIEALPRIIKGLRKEGLRMVTIPELLAIPQEK
jgi:peptidoglycan/xylan/chitin deacetylase (PgdA/CDA1 family)